MKKIILLSIFYLLLSTLVAQAALVPCGTESTHPCTWCDFGQLAKNIIDFLVYLVFPLAAIMIVVGGITIMTAGGSTERVAKGKEMVTAAVVGLLIALLAWLIIDTIIKMLIGAPEGGGTAIIKGFGPWNKINCF